MNHREMDSTDFVLHLQPRGAILYHRKSMFYFRLSGKGAELALLFSQNHGFEKTIRILQLRSQEYSDTDSIISDLDTHPFTREWKVGFFQKPLPITGSTKSYIPISCTLQLTNTCNLHCPFCYASSGIPYEKELTPQQWMSVMQELAANGVADLTLTGGEPSLAKGFRDMIVAASMMFTNVHVFTNGLRWSAEEVELISLLGNVVIQVSIDGKEETHDYLRGKKGAYRETVGNVMQFTKSSVPVYVAMTVNASNYQEVLDVAEASVKAGASLFRVGKMLPVGRATAAMSDLKKEQEDEVRRQLLEALNRWGDQITIVDWEENGQSENRDFCTPGYQAWYIRADGSVTVCQLEDWSIGNILTESVLEIGNPQRLIEAKRNARKCKCIAKVELGEIDLPFRINPIGEVYS